MAVIAQSTTEATAAGRMNPSTSDAPVAASSLPQRATKSCPAGLSRRSIGYRSRSITSARPVTGTPPHLGARGRDQSGIGAVGRASTQRSRGMIDETTGVPQLDLFDSLLRYARKTAWLLRRGSFSVAVPIAVRS